MNAQNKYWYCNFVSLPHITLLVTVRGVIDQSINPFINQSIRMTFPLALASFFFGLLCLSCRVSGFFLAGTRRIPTTNAGQGIPRTSCQSATRQDEPQVLSTGYSQALELTTALQEAVDMALEAIPPNANTIDLAVVSVSSLYDGNSKPSDVVPTVLAAASKYWVRNLIGCTNGGFIGSLANLNEPLDTFSDHDNDQHHSNFKACRPIEREGVPGVTVTLAILPDVNVQVSLVSIITILPSYYFRILTSLSFIDRHFMSWVTMSPTTMVGHRPMTGGQP